jgi:hypothetical protein
MLVLDANILIRAVLGTRVPWLLRNYGERGSSLHQTSPSARPARNLPIILKRRVMPVAPGLTTLDALSELVRTVEIDDYAPMEALARQRLARRDEDDWPILAAALALRCPIWTEDGLLVCANLGRRLSGGQAG